MFGFGKKKDDGKAKAGATLAAKSAKPAASTGGDKAALIAQAMAARNQAQAHIASLPKAEREAFERALADLAKAADARRNMQVRGVDKVQDLAAKHPEEAARAMRRYLAEKR